MAVFDRIRQAIRSAFGIVPTLDLHGLGVRDALVATERFVRDAHAHGITEVRIVYGKGHGSPGGRGLLREVVPHWLATDGATLVSRYQREPDHSGADGGARVWLRS